MRKIGYVLFDEKKVVALDINSAGDEVKVFFDGGSKLMFFHEDAQAIWDFFGGNEEGVEIATSTGKSEIGIPIGIDKESSPFND